MLELDGQVLILTIREILDHWNEFLEVFIINVFYSEHVGLHLFRYSSTFYEYIVLIAKVEKSYSFCTPVAAGSAWLAARPPDLVRE